jgi:hypothetical protein
VRKGVHSRAAQRLECWASGIFAHQALHHTRALRLRQQFRRRPGLEASVHASAWPPHLIRTLRADHQHSHQRDVICLLSVCSVRSVQSSDKSTTLRLRRSAMAPGHPPKLSLLRGAEVLRKFLEIPVALPKFCEILKGNGRGGNAKRFLTKSILK